MFRIGEVDNNAHSILSSSSSSRSLIHSNSDRMSRTEEKCGGDFFQESSVFGSFDPDDPDFSGPHSGGQNSINRNNSNNLLNWATNRLFNQASTSPSRPSSRQSMGRNNSSNGLKRTTSTNSMGGSRFYIGISFLLILNLLLM